MQGMHLRSGAKYNDNNDHNHYHISATMPCPSSTAAAAELPLQEPMMELSSFQRFSRRGGAAPRLISEYNHNSTASRVLEMKRPWPATMVEAEADIRAAATTAITASNSRRKVCYGDPPAISSGEDR